MLQATLAGDTGTMEHILEQTHDLETPILSYNHETELTAVVNLAYLSARDYYRVEREEKRERALWILFLSGKSPGSRRDHFRTEGGSLAGGSY